MYKHKPSNKGPQLLPSDPLRNITIALHRKPVTIQLNIQPPQQSTTVERSCAHEDIQQRARHVTVLPKGIRRIKRANNVRGAEKKCASPAGLPQRAPGIHLIDIQPRETGSLVVGQHGGFEVEAHGHDAGSEELQPVGDAGVSLDISGAVGVALGGGEENVVFEDGCAA
jgi:hypothetical protein